MSDSALIVAGVEIVVILTPLTVIVFNQFRSDRNQKLLAFQRDTQSIQDRMLRAFRREISTSYRISQQCPAGKFRLLEFCSEAEVDAALGKQFLQKQVEEFAGIVDVDDYGDITYFFGDAKVQFMNEDLEKDKS